MPLPRPKRTAKPRDFYLEYLPSLWTALTGGSTVPVADHAITAIIGGERFTLRFEGGALAASEGGSGALVELTASVDSWRIATFDLLPRLLGWGEKRVSDFKGLVTRVAASADPRRVSTSPGVVEVHYVDDAGDPAEVVLRIAGGGSRRVRVELNDAELWRLLEGGGRLSQLVRSRIRLDGDLGYALELAGALEAQTIRK